jgi:hypothetical protein
MSFVIQLFVFCSTSCTSELYTELLAVTVVAVEVAATVATILSPQLKTCRSSRSSISGSTAVQLESFDNVTAGSYKQSIDFSDVN